VPTDAYRIRKHRECAGRRKKADHIAELLLEAFGWKCAKCGSDKKLEFDHPKGRDYDPTRMNRYQRMRKYLHDFLEGNLRLLCRKCNAKDGHARRYQREDYVPF
jgi:hypothetical protein